MLASNGLMCLSGVTMCRMCLSAMIACPPSMRYVGCRASRRPSRNVRAAIERRADADVEAVADGIGPHQCHEPGRLLGRSREGKPGRSPRALPCGVRAGAPQHIEAGGDARAGEAAAALHGSKMVAENFLHGRDGGAKIFQIL